MHSSTWAPVGDTIYEGSETFKWWILVGDSGPLRAGLGQALGFCREASLVVPSLSFLAEGMTCEPPRLLLCLHASLTRAESAP